MEGNIRKSWKVKFTGTLDGIHTEDLSRGPRSDSHGVVKDVVAKAGEVDLALPKASKPLITHRVVTRITRKDGTKKWRCSCRMCEVYGIICRHLLKVMEEGVTFEEVVGLWFPLWLVAPLETLLADPPTVIHAYYRKRVRAIQAHNKGRKKKEKLAVRAPLSLPFDGAEEDSEVAEGDDTEGTLGELKDRLRRRELVLSKLRPLELLLSHAAWNKDPEATALVSGCWW